MILIVTALVTAGSVPAVDTSVQPQASPATGWSLDEPETADESSDETVEARTLEQTFAQLPDPDGWSQEPVTGLEYRRTTGQEQTTNAWQETTLLAEEGDLAEAADFPGGLTAILPLGDGTAHPVTLEKTDTRTQATFTETQLDGESRSQDLTLVQYEGHASTSRGEGNVRLTADDGGGYHLQAAIGPLELSITPSADWWALERLTEGDADPPVRDGLALVQLSADRQPTADSIGEAWTATQRSVSEGSAEPLTHSDENFGLMGEMKWCTRYESSWQTKINTIGNEITNGFADTDVDMAQEHDHCWIATDLQTAESCANNGGCSDAQGHDYPYNGDGDAASAYLADAWDDVSHSRDHYNFDGLHAVHVVHDGLLSTSYVDVCGDANAPPSGASVAAGLPLPSGCEDYVSTHEMGHSFDATHDNTVESGCGTVMAQSSQISCRWNYFNEPGESEVENCETSSGCPRWGTG